jgi:FMN phosphatase YigB (HAD superfamily)
VLPFVPEVLNKLKGMRIDDHMLRLGVISNTDGETFESMRRLLSDAGLLEMFDPKLLVFSSVEGMKKDNPQIFARAAERAGLAPRDCLFVGENEMERKVAGSVGFRVSYHPLHAFHVIQSMTERRG